MFIVEAGVYANADPAVTVDWNPVSGVVTDDPTGPDSDDSYTASAAALMGTTMVAYRVTATEIDEVLRGVHDAGSGGRTGTSGAIVTVSVENNPDYASGITSVTNTFGPAWEFLGCSTYYTPGDDNSTDVPFNGAALNDEEWSGSGPMADGPSGPGCVTPASVNTVDAGNCDGTANTVVVWDSATLGAGATLAPGGVTELTSAPVCH